jgi:hypothetical protein
MPIQDDYDEVIELLCDMVKQNVQKSKDKPYKYYSGFISIHAEVLRYLCNQGIMKPTEDYLDRIFCNDRDFKAVFMEEE